MSDLDALAPSAEASLSWVSSSAEKLSQMLCSESSAGYRRAALALVAVFVLLGLALIVVGYPPVTGPWVEMNLLDGAWRIVNGQVPHTDFHTPLGSLTFLVVAFGMKIAAPSAASITYGNLLLLALLIPWAWCIASARLPWAIAFVFTLFAGFYLISPRPLSNAFRETTYAMIYNRQGYVLIMMLVLCLFLRPRDSTKQFVSLNGVFVGGLLALLLYCKITYFLAAAILTPIAIVLDLRLPRWYLASAGAFVGACAAFFAVFRINLHSYLSDIAMAGHSQSLPMRIKLLSQSVSGNATWLYILIFSLWLCSCAESRPGRSRISSLRAWLVAGSIVAAGVLISSGNATQEGGADDPLYFMAAVVFLELLRRKNAEQVAQPGTAVRFVYTASLALMLPFFCGTILARDLASYAYAMKWNLREHRVYPASERMHSVRLRDFYVPSTTAHSTAYWAARDHPARINDGIDLLQRFLQKGDRVTTIAFANPFSFALGIKPARDSLLFWDLNVSFNGQHYPSAEDFLGDASVVMVPRLADRTEGCCFDTADWLLGHYGDYLRSHFREIASTDIWVLYRRIPQT